MDFKFIIRLYRLLKIYYKEGEYMERFNVMPILTLLLGTLLGVVIALIINYIRNKTTESKANKLIENASKEAEKKKRDALLELKEESYRLKQETDKEITTKRTQLR